MEQQTDQNPAIKQPKIIVVAGIERSGSSFLHKAICEAIRLAGFTVQSAINLSRGSHKENWILDGVKVETLNESNLKETDFIVIRVFDYSIELEAKANLVFTSTRKSMEIFTSMNRLQDPKDARELYTIKDVLDSFENLVKWMRSGKQAYCMDFNSPMNAKGLHNYANLRNIMLPMNFAFRPLDFFKDREGKNLNPADLIEAIIPGFKAKSEEAKRKSKEVLANKAEQMKKEDRDGSED